MGSPITLSGFNQIDFSSILNAVMQQESIPLASLETQQSALKSRTTTYATLATKLSAFESAVGALADKDAGTGRTTSNTDASVASAVATDAAAPGIYDIQVQELARAQVTAAVSAPGISFPPDADQTVVASTGTLVVGGVTVTVEGPATLQGLADLINSNHDVPVTATVVRSAANSYQLVLTGKATGAAGAFTIANTLSGGAAGVGVAFGDDDSDGLSGNSVLDNAVSATDASVLINNVVVTSASNVIEGAIQGVTLNLLKKSPGTTSTITIAEDTGTIKAKLQAVVSTYNDLVKFSTDQATKAANGDASSISRDPLLRGLRNQLRLQLTAEYTAGGDYQSLATVGLELDRSGKLLLNESRFAEASKTGKANMLNLFSADGATEADKGAFTAIKGLVETYTNADGLLKDLNSRLSQQMSSLTTRISDLDARLQVRRASLQREFTEADLIMTRLNSQTSTISSLGAGYRLF